MIWKKPHISKIYEALTAIADSRIELDGPNKAKCFSSSKGKFYETEYDSATNQIMSNDNTAYYTDSVSYPMIALLMLNGKIEYDQSLLETLKGIYWKDINQKFKNNYDQAIEFVLTDLSNKGVDISSLKLKIDNIFSNVCNLELSFLGPKRLPPSGY
ncbi:MAG: hypothetical protein WCT01_03050 [Candidatus Shapirobacteria bacterium]|jgi:hypothetical protein